MRSILKSTFILVTVAVMGVVGYTTAFYQDTETSIGNGFDAGSLNLFIDEPSQAVWTAENMLPGDEIEGEIELENVGSLPINSLIMEVGGN